MIRKFTFTFVLCFLIPASAIAAVVKDGPEFQVNTYTPDFQDSADVAFLPNGGFVVVWNGPQEQGQTTRGILGQRFGAGGQPVGGEFLINDIAAGYDRDSEVSPRVAAGAADDGFVVIWDGGYDQDGSEDGIFGRRFDASGSKLGKEFLVNSYTPYSQREGVVAMYADGSFTVVWQDTGGFRGNPRGILGRSFDAAGSPLGGEFVVADDTLGSPTGPSVAPTGDGEFVAAWYSLQRDGSGDAVIAQRFALDGSKIGTSFVVNSYTTGDQRVPDVAAQRDGFVIVWNSLGQDGSNYGIFGQKFDRMARPVGTEFAVNSYTTDAQRRPFVAEIGNGGFVVVWVSAGQDGSELGVFGQYFDSTPAPVGTEFQANTYTTGSQGGDTRGFGVSGGPAGEFVVVWTSDQYYSSGGDYGAGQDGDASGIFAQRFVASASCGDMNGDGEMSANDALRILGAAVGSWICNPCLCDANQSGNVSATDALLVLQAGAGQAVSLACPACS